MPGDRPRPAVGTTFFACLCDPGLHAIAKDVPLELGEDREHAGQSPAARRGQVECLAERDEADPECGQLLNRRDEVDQGAPPAIQPPHQVYLGRAVKALRERGGVIADDLVAHLSPLGWEHINLTGDYVWNPGEREEQRPLRQLRLSFEQGVSNP